MKSSLGNVDPRQVEVVVHTGDKLRKDPDTLGIFIFEDETSLPESGGFPGMNAGDFIRKILMQREFTGRLEQAAVAYTVREGTPVRIILAGLGKKADFSPEKLRIAAAAAGKTAQSCRAGTLSLVLDADQLNLDWSTATEAVVEGVFLGTYRFTFFKTLEKEENKPLSTLALHVSGRQHLPPVREAAAKALKICRAVYFARDLVSLPANELTPAALAAKAREQAGRFAKMNVAVMEGEEMEHLGMHALLGVARGSGEAPKFIIVNYQGAESSLPPIVLVGKALTFDSGGISLKPAEKMDEMKSDMAGGAAVLGAITAAADLGLRVNLVGLIPATENMPGGRACKPGDILRSMSGRTIEVVNTDAEGRLILADALHYASKYHPAAIIDLATLTGACIVALGERVAGLMGTDDKLKERIKKAAAKTGELVWELPLWEHYHEQIKSDIADFKNSAGRNGGAVTAAAFLSKFAGTYPWVHLDIAGPAWVTKETPYCPKGASGVGVRLLLQFLVDWREGD